MTFKSGLFRVLQSGFGPLLTQPDLGLRMIRPVTGKAAGRQHQTVTPAICASSDVLGNASLLAAVGAKYIFTDFCPGVEWFSDGQYLHPEGGSAVIMQSGTVANPIATVTLAGTTGGFGAGIKVTIPSNLLIPGKSSVKIEALMRHTTAVGTANFNVRFGNLGGTGDSDASLFAVNTTTNQESRVDALVSIAANGVDYNTTNQTAPGGQATGGSNDRIGSIVLTSPLIVSADISAGTSGDVFKLVFLKVVINQ